LILARQINVRGAAVSNTGNTAAEPFSTFAAIDGATAAVRDQIAFIPFVGAGFLYRERFAATGRFAEVEGGVTKFSFAAIAAIRECRRWATT
jgi:hypothetical protein